MHFCGQTRLGTTNGSRRALLEPFVVWIAMVRVFILDSSTTDPRATLSTPHVIIIETERVCQAAEP